MATKNSLPVNLRPGYKKTEREKDIQENGFNGTRDRQRAAAKEAVNQAQERGKTRTTQQKVKDLYNSPIGQKAQQYYNALTSEKKTSSESAPAATAEKKKKDPNRFKAISDKANASRTAEQNAAIKKNNDRIYWKNKERMNNSGSYRAMMQSRTKGEMQRASKRDATAMRENEMKAYEKAFGKKKGR